MNRTKGFMLILIGFWLGSIGLFDLGQWTPNVYAADYGSARSYLDLGINGVKSGFSTDYSYNFDWSYQYLREVRERGSVGLEADPGYGGGIGYSYFFNDIIGIGGRIDYCASDLKVNSDYSMYWRWNDGRSYTTNDDEDGQGSLTQSALSFNALFRLANGRVVPMINLGLTYFSSIVDADAKFGYAMSLYDYYAQYLDYFWLDAKLDKTVQTVGGHLGLTLDFALSSNSALRLSAAYYYSPTTEADWQFQSGYYAGQYDVLNLNLYDEGAKNLSEGYKEEFGSVEVDPSFMVASVGFVFAF